MADRLAVIGSFAELRALVSAVESFRREGIGIATVYSPFQSSEIREALGEPPLGPGRFITLAGGIAGILTGIFLAWYTAAQWRFIVGGKYPIPYVPTVIPAFEFFILLSILFTLGGMLFLNRMPQKRLPKFYDGRFSRDRFGLVVYCADSDWERISRMMTDLGAQEVLKVEE